MTSDVTVDLTAPMATDGTKWDYTNPGNTPYGLTLPASPPTTTVYITVTLDSSEYCHEMPTATWDDLRGTGTQLYYCPDCSYCGDSEQTLANHPPDCVCCGDRMAIVTSIMTELLRGQ